MNLEIRCLVTKPDGSMFYREEHAWSDVSPQMLAWLKGELDDFYAKCKKEENKKDDDANLSAEFTGRLDSEALPVQRVSGISYKSLAKLEREWHKVGDKLIRIGEKKAGLPEGGEGSGQGMNKPVASPPGQGKK